MELLKGGKKFIIVSLLTIICAVSTCIGIGAYNVKADTETDNTFVMLDGVQLKLSDDCGIRYKVKIGKDKYDEIVTNDTENKVTMQFIITSRIEYDKINDGNYLNVEKKYIVNVDEQKIYFDDGYYYAHGCLIRLSDNNKRANLVSVAVINTEGESETTHEYAKINNIENITRNLYDVVNKATIESALDEASFIYNCKGYSWFGSENFPIKVMSEAQYEGLKDKIQKEFDFTGKTIYLGKGLKKAEDNELFSNLSTEPTEISYTVDFKDANGNVILSNSDYAFGDEVILPSESELEKQGYTFYDWDNIVVAVNDNATYNAIYTKNIPTEHTIELPFNIYGVSSVNVDKNKLNIHYTYGQMTVLNGERVLKHIKTSEHSADNAGFQFYSKNNNVDKLYLDFYVENAPASAVDASKVKLDLRLNQYSASPQIIVPIIKTSNGSVVDRLNLEKGVWYTAEYDVSGIKTSEEGLTYKIYTTQTNGDETVVYFRTPYFKGKQCTVTFKFENGEDDYVQKLYKGETVIVPENSTKEDANFVYELDGWDIEPNTVCDGDATYKAKYKKSTEKCIVDVQVTCNTASLISVVTENIPESVNGYSIDGTVYRYVNASTNTNPSANFTNAGTVKFKDINLIRELSFDIYYQSYGSRPTLLDLCLFDASNNHYSTLDKANVSVVDLSTGIDVSLGVDRSMRYVGNNSNGTLSTGKWYRVTIIPNFPTTGVYKNDLCMCFWGNTTNIDIYYANVKGKKDLSVTTNNGLQITSNNRNVVGGNYAYTKTTSHSAANSTNDYAIKINGVGYSKISFDITFNSFSHNGNNSYGPYIDFKLKVNGADSIYKIKDSNAKLYYNGMEVEVSDKESRIFGNNNGNGTVETGKTYTVVIDVPTNIVGSDGNIYLCFWGATATMLYISNVHGIN